MNEVADTQIKVACKQMEAYSAEAKSDAQKKSVTFLPFAADKKAEIEKALEQNVGPAWAKELDSRGKQGSTVLADFTRLIDASQSH
jgi:TRAP-type C4-dicarboxylate transport system substrate-binding protein